MMKILLMLPINRQSELENSVDPLNDNGLGYIAAACKEAGADVTLLSWNVNMDIKTFQQKLIELNPDLIGVKVLTTYFRQAYDTLNIVRQTLPNAITIIGGPHPSTSRPKDLFHEFDKVLDFAIRGDGEYGITSIIQKIRAAGGIPEVEALKDVAGLAYRDGDSVRYNKPFFESNLDNLPCQDWSIQQPASFKESLNARDNLKDGNKALVQDSRGCPARCGHCMACMVNGSKPRKRSLEYLYAEIDELINKYNVRTIEFTGNSFLSDIDYVEELCHWFLERGSYVQWGCTGAAYVRNLRNPKLLTLMQRAGCKIIHFGIESGNTNVRKLLCKTTPLQEYTEFVNLTVTVGILAAGYFMFGFPDETVKEMNDTIKYAMSLPFNPIGFAICLPLPATSSYKALLNQKQIDMIDWYSYDFSNPMLPCKASLHQVKLKLFQTKILCRSKLARRFYSLIH